MQRADPDEMGSGRGLQLCLKIVLSKAEKVVNGQGWWVIHIRNEQVQLIVALKYIHTKHQSTHNSIK